MHRYGKSVLSIMLACMVFQANIATAQDSAVVGRAAYFGMAGKYDSLSFDVGPLLTIESPDPDRYRDLHIAAHEGLPRVGFLDDYGAKLPTQNFEARNAKQLVTKRLGDEFEAYSGLLALHFAKAHFAPDILLGGKQVAGTTPKGFAMGLAGNMVTDTVFKGYFCGGKPNCGDTKSRSLYQHSPRLTLSLARRWGGAKDEFAARAALETFIDKDLGPLVEWSEALPTEAAFAGYLVLPEYDFSKQGFAFHVTLPSDAGPRSSTLGFLLWERAESTVKVLTPNTNSTTAFLPMAPGDAEKLTESAKVPGRSSLVYFVVRGKFYNVDYEQADLRSNRGFRLLYELTSPTITFYRDAALTDKIADATMQPE